ncbi:MAG: phosphopentomutase [Erysipelotrichaceae bacterium]|nr:phosphopentomutase [Erysipelotrichaceae bacterium]
MKRIFVIVLDSLGIGYDPESPKYNDEGANTLGHIFEATEGRYQIPNLQKMGLCNLTEVKNNYRVDDPIAYYGRMHEASIGKDTLTGHHEMMGVYTTNPFVTFTDTGFPKELIDELEKRTGHKFIGNISASGTEIIKQLGERQLQTKEMIIYTSADSVLQIAAHEELFGIDEIYRVCEIAREITLNDEWRVGRVIARPFVGTNKDDFVRTSNRHDYALNPSSTTVLDVMKAHDYDVISIGKINDIFNGMGITESIKSRTSEEGFQQTIDVAKTEFNGICFTNLVDFDAQWGHRRDPRGYARELVRFDSKLPDMLDALEDDDLLILTADHGNDPTWHGTDHTREYVPILVYNKRFTEQRNLGTLESFACIGATISDYFGIPYDSPIGHSFKNDLK